MVLRDATSLQGALVGEGPENWDFLGHEIAPAKRVPFGPKKLNALSNDVAHLKTIKYKINKKQLLHW